MPWSMCVAVADAGTGVVVSVSPQLAEAARQEFQRLRGLR